MRNRRLPLLAAGALFLAPVAAAEPEWPYPLTDEIAAGPARDKIEYGEKLITETFAHLGPEAPDPALRFAGNNLACGSCHLDGGRRRYGLSLIGVRNAYPRNMARENSEQSLAQRINGCLERSMNGRAMPEDSAEMDAMIAYIGFLSDAAPKGLEGRGTPDLALLSRAADPARGEQVYRARCAECHGADGQGVKTEGGLGYLYPPLWGPDSFNTGAGMHRLITSARFIRANMPFGATFDAPQLTEEEAWDVAAYVNAQARPEKEGLDRDYPDRSRKPVDAPFGPYDDSFPREQHILGPFQPIIDARDAAASK